MFYDVFQLGQCVIEAAYGLLVVITDQLHSFSLPVVALTVILSDLLPPFVVFVEEMIGF